jgi:cytoskeletal protein CcmA (bactofilin family)
MFRKKEDAPITPAADAARPAELPQRRFEAQAAPDAAASASAGLVKPLPVSEPTPVRQVETGKQKRLIVGSGIRMSGEITACDRLVVEGFVEARLNETRALEIAEGGQFKGGCLVEEAEITGVYEGDLTVRGRLMIRATGKVDGNIQYGDLEIERGGQIGGTVSRLEGSKAASTKTSD